MDFRDFLLEERTIRTRLSDKAKIALEEQAYDEREFGGVTLAIDPKDIPLAKDLLKQFYLDLREKLATDNAEAVYHLNVAFFRLDKKAENAHH